MKRFLGRLVGLLSVLAALAPANADDTALRSALADKTAQEHVLEAAKQTPAFAHDPCPSATFSFTGRVAVYVTPERDPAGALTKGAWKQQVHEEGCGHERLLNVLVAVQGPGRIGTMPLLPGGTRGDPQLQRDGIRYAMIATQVAAKDCKQGYVEETEFADQGDKAIQGGKSPPWREVWTVVACGRKAQVPMRFIPDATGTTIAADAAKFDPAEPGK